MNTRENDPVFERLGISHEFPWREYTELEEKTKTKLLIIFRVYKEMLGDPDHIMMRRRSQYISASNALRYRYASMVLHDEGFRQALGTDGHYGRFLEEKELFEFFVNALSVFEVFSYGLYFLGSFTKENDRFLKTRFRQITPTETLQSLKNKYPNERVTGELDALLSSNEYIQIGDIRNVLAHRCSPGRQVYLSNVQVEADIWKLKNLKIDAQLTPPYRHWVATKLTALLTATTEFFEANTFLEDE